MQRMGAKGVLTFNMKIYYHASCYLPKLQAMMRKTKKAYAIYMAKPKTYPEYYRSGRSDEEFEKDRIDWNERYIRRSDHTLKEYHKTKEETDARLAELKEMFPSLMTLSFMFHGDVKMFKKKKKGKVPDSKILKLLLEEDDEDL